MVKCLPGWRKQSPPASLTWEPVSVVTATYANDPVDKWLYPTSGGNEVSDLNKILATDTPGDGTWYYALTSEEHSGLCSEVTSQVIRVTVSGGAVTSTMLMSPETDFVTVFPSAPTGFAAANKDGNNHYSLSWSEPTDTHNLVRGYSIYYHETVNPSPVQANRIATVPKGTTSWKDWGADLSVKGKWGITTIDKYGNESSVLYDDATTGAAPLGRPTRPGGIPARTSDDAGLTQLDDRRSRFAGATWSAATLENNSTYKWQPETCMFYDPDTGHECWKITSSNGKMSIYHDDIGVSPWNANGSKMAFRGFNRVSQLYGGSQTGFETWWMTVNSDGTSLRPVNGVRRYATGYFHWDPQVPNQYFEIGETHLGTGASTNQLSRTTINSDGVCTTNIVLTLSAGAAGGIINKMLWPSGLEMVVENFTTLRWYPLTIGVDGTVTQSDSDGYSMDRSYGSYGGHSGAAVGSYHDQYPGAPGWAFVMPTDTNGPTATWWRQQITGTAADGGPLYTGNDGNDDFGEVWPENHSTVDVGSLYSPWTSNPTDEYDANKVSYMSHFCPDNWGKYIVFSNSADNTPIGEIGTGIWDIENHSWVVPSFGNQAQHHDWSGWCNSVVSSGSTAALDYDEDKVMCALDYADIDSQYLVAYTHTRVLGGAVDRSYNSLARPGQSPDGTKVAWHSEFLNAVDLPDSFWSVCYYPLPPTSLEAQTGGVGEVELSFLPPKYTNRMWNDHEVYAREIKQYRLWRSPGE